jgi:[protein-PII] uridylyltransferase
MNQALLSNEVRELYAGEASRIRQEFELYGDGRLVLRSRAALMDRIVVALWENHFSSTPEHQRPTLIAIGGYGKKALFPHSDLDILFLHESLQAEDECKEPIRSFSQELWDIGIKVSPASRTLAECDRFDPTNAERFISLLDCRFVTGKQELFGRLRDKVVPAVVARESQEIVQRLVELTRSRHAKYGNTVFHLEPNVKDGPGGVRDYNVAHWLALISALDKLHNWPNPDTLLPVSMRRRVESAADFVFSVRCFLHWRHGRDDNNLSWAAQDEAASRKIGSPEAQNLSAADWMRLYFGHARALYRISTQLLDEVSAEWSSLYRQFQSWRSRISNSEFSVVHGMVFIQQPASLQDSETLLRLFHFIAHHGLKLSTTTEQRVEQALPSIAATPPRGAELWIYLQEILLQPHAAEALRTMHALRFLTLLLPEVKAIDSLVVRDYYHRFTVDEHTFVAIESLHALPQSQSEWDQRYAALQNELEQPELLYLAILVHDLGKGISGTDHVSAGMGLAERCLERLDLEPQDRETVLFLVGNHLAMSAALRRDIFDSETVRSFSETVESPERLKMLTLMTYADIKAVNPEALTPWKAENIWQLYIETANYLNFTVDQRLHADSQEEEELVRTLTPVAGRRVKQFLEGLPRRYLATYPAKSVLAHLEMAGHLKGSGVRLALERGKHWFDLTVVTTDRPLLFAKITGVLAAWGMSIVKANAFSNSAGVVVDTFHFIDRFRTLELNIPEWDRFKRSIEDVLNGKEDLDKLLRSRMRTGKDVVPKTRIETSVEFHEEASARSSVLQVIAQDRPGLLYRISSRLAGQGCNIEIALIDTEGEMAIDVFYLTSKGRKLTPEQHYSVAAGVREELNSAQ